MPCIYGLASWLGLRFKDEAIVFDTFREMYEAFVIYHFVTYLIVYLTQNDTIESLLAHKAVQAHIWPMNHVWQARRRFGEAPHAFRSTCSRSRSPPARLAAVEDGPRIPLQVQGWSAHLRAGALQPADPPKLRSPLPTPNSSPPPVSLILLALFRALSCLCLQVRPITAIIALISEYNGVYGEGNLWDPLQVRICTESVTHVGVSIIALSDADTTPSDGRVALFPVVSVV